MANKRRSCTVAGLVVEASVPVVGAPEPRGVGCTEGIHITSTCRINVACRASGTMIEWMSAHSRTRSETKGDKSVDESNLFSFMLFCSPRRQKYSVTVHLCEPARLWEVPVTGER